MIVALMSVIQRFSAGFKNRVKSSIISGRIKIESPSLGVEWMKLTLSQVLRG